MQEKKHSPFYEPSQQELQDQEQQNILDALSQQQNNIRLLLSKYQDSDAKQQQPAVSDLPKKIKGKSPIARKRSPAINGQQELEELLASVKLPSIQRGKLGSHKQPAGRKSRAQLKNQAQAGRDKTTLERQSLKKQIEKEYKQKQRKHRPKRMTNNTQILQYLTLDTHPQVQSQKNPPSLLVPADSSIAKPMPHRKVKAERVSSESDEEGEVSIKFYDNEWQQLYEQQCKEQLNFLYFSSAVEMNEWSQEMMRVMTRQDEALERLHRRMKVLSRFDEGYFASSVYGGK